MARIWPSQLLRITQRHPGHLSLQTQRCQPQQFIIERNVNMSGSRIGRDFPKMLPWSISSAGRDDEDKTQAGRRRETWRTESEAGRTREGGVQSLQ